MTIAKIIAIGVPQTFRYQIARTLGLESEVVEWMPTVTAAEAYLTGSNRGGTVFVLSPAVKEEDAFGLADFVGRNAPATAVLLVRDRAMNGLLPAAMRAGIRDVVDLSRGATELRDALTKAIQWSENLQSISQEPGTQGPSRNGMVISVFSSKGGTGKTFLSCNLAAAIAQATNSDTAVIDLDQDLGDVFAYFGKDPARPLQDLVAAADTNDRDTVLSLGTQFVDHLWGYGSPHDPTAASAGGEAIGKAIRALKGAFDHTVIDASADYADSTLAAFDLSDHICLITGLDVVGVRHLATAYQTLQSLGIPREKVKVVMNRADSKVGIDTEDVKRVTKLPIDAAIPSSRLVPVSLNRARPVVIYEPRSEVAKAVQEFAERLTAVVPASAPEPSKRKLFGRS